MRYVMARWSEEQREMAYRIYVTDCLKHLIGAESRYYDIIDTTEPDSRTIEEIVDSIWSKIGGEKNDKPL